jgi:hypothetical protein
MPLVIFFITTKMKYLFEKEYQTITKMFIDGSITQEQYFIFVEYYENETTKKLFTINLN